MTQKISYDLSKTFTTQEIKPTQILFKLNGTYFYETIFSGNKGTIITGEDTLRNISFYNVSPHKQESYKENKTLILGESLDVSFNNENQSLSLTTYIPKFINNAKWFEKINVFNPQFRLLAVIPFNVFTKLENEPTPKIKLIAFVKNSNGEILSTMESVEYEINELDVEKNTYLSIDSVVDNTLIMDNNYIELVIQSINFNSSTYVEVENTNNALFSFVAIEKEYTEEQDVLFHLLGFNYGKLNIDSQSKLQTQLIPLSYKSLVKDIFFGGKKELFQTYSDNSKGMSWYYYDYQINNGFKSYFQNVGIKNFLSYNLNFILNTSKSLTELDVDFVVQVYYKNELKMEHVFNNINSILTNEPWGINNNIELTNVQFQYGNLLHFQYGIRVNDVGDFIEGDFIKMEKLNDDQDFIKIASESNNTSYDPIEVETPNSQWIIWKPTGPDEIYHTITKTLSSLTGIPLSTIQKYNKFTLEFENRIYTVNSGVGPIIKSTHIIPPFDIESEPTVFLNLGATATLLRSITYDLDFNFFAIPNILYVNGGQLEVRLVKAKMEFVNLNRINNLDEK